MSKEAFYDEHIAPKLIELGKQCEERGLSFMAVCEWEPGEFGETCTLQDDRSYAMSLVRWAIQSKANVDKLMIAVMKHAGVRGHGSVILKQLGVPYEPKDSDDDPR